MCSQTSGVNPFENVVDTEDLRRLRLPCGVDAVAEEVAHSRVVFLQAKRLDPAVAPIYRQRHWRLFTVVHEYKILPPTIA